MDWAEVLPHGMISDLVNETGLLTPTEARAKAADLIAAADTIDRGLHRLMPGSHRT